jgi:hypothetical protein
MAVPTYAMRLHFTVDEYEKQMRTIERQTKILKGRSNTARKG